MPTEHCPECQPKKSCANSHVYVIELRPEVAEGPADKSDKGYLYVGLTGKSVEERFRDNYLRKDGTAISIEKARTHSEDGQWKYQTPNIKKIRKFYLKHRPDLFYRKINPVEYLSSSKAAERREGKLADKLRRRGWMVWGPTGEPKCAGDKAASKGAKKR